MAFWYIFAQGIVGNIVLWFVNPEKAKLSNAKCEYLATWSS